MAALELDVDAKDVFDVALKIERDIKIKFDELNQKVDELTTYAIQAKALEQDRRLPDKIEAQAARITALEHALTTAKAFAGFASILSTLLGIVQVVKALNGH